MNADTELRESILVSLDPAFTGAGFTRRKRSFAWRKRVSPDLTEIVHLNFGRYGHSVSVSPSIGVRHDRVEQALAACGAGGTADRPTFTKMLDQLADARYSAEISEGSESVSSLIWADWCAEGHRFVAEVSDLGEAIRLLESPVVRDWPCFGRSFRARLLPVSLAVAGRRPEALTWLDVLRNEMSGQDQLLPGFHHFEESFRTAVI